MEDMFGNKIKPERDTKRYFTLTQRKEILHQQDMKCAVCHKKLDPRDIEYDHKKPWASGGRTKTVNGRALHGSCHNKVTHKAKLNAQQKGRARKQQPKPDLLGFGSFGGGGYSGHRPDWSL